MAAKVGLEKNYVEGTLGRCSGVAVTIVDNTKDCFQMNVNQKFLGGSAGAECAKLPWRNLYSLQRNAMRAMCAKDV